MCEIVNNEACGKRFQYCRTHKVEPKDCPKPKETVATSRVSGWPKIGDKVKILKSPWPEFIIGEIYLVEESTFGNRPTIKFPSGDRQGIGAFVDCNGKHSDLDFDIVEIAKAA